MNTDPFILSWASVVVRRYGREMRWRIGVKQHDTPGFLVIFNEPYVIWRDLVRVVG